MYYIFETNTQAVYYLFHSSISYHFILLLLGKSVTKNNDRLNFLESL
jgi:hypothetical protein